METYLINRWDNLKKILVSQYNEITPQDLEGEASEVLSRIAEKLNLSQDQLMNELEYLGARTV